MIEHTNLIKDIMLKAPENVRLFQNPVGLGYTKNGTPIRFGLMPGSADIIGITLVRGIGIFTSIEVKTPEDDVRPKQKKWFKNIRQMGGITIVARNVEECWRDHAIKCSLIEKMRFNGLSFGQSAVQHNGEALERGATL